MRIHSIACTFRITTRQVLVVLRRNSRTPALAERGQSCDRWRRPRRHIRRVGLPLRHSERSRGISKRRKLPYCRITELEARGPAQAFEFCPTPRAPRDPSASLGMTAVWASSRKERVRFSKGVLVAAMPRQVLSVPFVLWVLFVPERASLTHGGPPESHLPTMVLEFM